MASRRWLISGKIPKSLNGIMYFFILIYGKLHNVPFQTLEHQRITYENRKHSSLDKQTPNEAYSK